MAERERSSAGRPTQHARLAAHLRDAIGSGEYEVGGRLPAEHELCAAHGLSRGTVRVALRSLEDQGLISRRPGAGTTVLSRRPLDAYAPVVASRDDVVDLYRTTRVAVPAVSRVNVDEDLASWMGVATGEEWLLVEGPRRLRGVTTGRALAWTEQYIPLQEAALDLSSPDGLAAAMPTHRLDQSAWAVSLPDKMAADLDAHAGSPALVIARRHLAADGALLSASLHTHAGTRVPIAVSDAPQTAPDGV